MSSIPNDDDFARADGMMAARDRNLDLVRANVKRKLSKLATFHDVYILWQRDVDFRAYVFFKQDKDIDVCKDSGVAQEIEDCVYDELNKAGRGNRSQTTVAFEYDSDEHVERDYGGNYYLRLL